MAETGIREGMPDDRERPALLGDDAPIPIERPFTRPEAVSLGVTDRQLAAWCGTGLLVHPIPGVYHAAQIPDGPELRISCLQLAVPEDAVVTDRTAAWLHGASMVLAPNDHLEVPRVSMFRPTGYRLRNKLATSGERSFAAGEVVELDGLRVTSKLRTTCDLGMMRNRDQAFSAMEAMARIADFGLRQLVDLAVGPRFKGYRRVCQFRDLAPLVDPRSQSPAESILRLRWLDCPELPIPTPQLPVPGPGGHDYFLDLGVEGIRYAAEYDGARWHGREQQQHDRERRAWMARTGEWMIDVFVDHHLFGPRQNADVLLRQGVAEARRRMGASAWRGQDRELQDRDAW